MIFHWYWIDLLWLNGEYDEVLKMKLTWILFLANFTLKWFPCQFQRIALLFSLQPGLEPSLETLQMDIFHRPSTFTGAKQRIFISVVIVETDPTGGFVFFKTFFGGTLLLLVVKTRLYVHFKQIGNIPILIKKWINVSFKSGGSFKDCTY